MTLNKLVYNRVSLRFSKLRRWTRRGREHGEAEFFLVMDAVSVGDSRKCGEELERKKKLSVYYTQKKPLTADKEHP
jgi:hypothetical protein